MKHALGLTLFVTLLLFQASLTIAATLHVSAAASMNDALKEIVTLFAQNQPATEVILNFGSSGAMAKQIDQGAPCDLFISANPTWMEFLVENSQVDGTSQRILVTNELVFFGLANPNISSLTDLTQLKRIGIGSPLSVPAGQYARQALEAVGLYDRLAGAGALVMAKDVRQALIYADRGETDGSFVYRTDARLGVSGVILFAVPADLHAPITYPLALTKQGSTRQEARLFYEFLFSPPAQEILGRHGFTTPP